MKKNTLLYLLFASLLFAGCTKNDGPVSKEIALERVPAPLIVKDPTGSASIDMTNLAGFMGKINISLYFPNDIPPAKLDIVIRKNNNNSNVKLVQADVKTFPISITLTAAQIAGFFGPLTLGDSYDIGADVYAQSGKVYHAFPVVGNGYATGFQPDHPGFSASTNFSAICAYNPTIYKGNFVILQDDWADYAVGDVVPITQINATQFSFNYQAAGPVPIVVTVNPLTNVTSVAKQVYGTLGYPPGWPFGPISVASVPSPVNIVAPCDQTFGVNLQHTVAAGSFGANIIRMKKQ